MPRIYHAGIDTTIDCPPSAVHVHERSGWVLVDEDAPAKPRKRRGKQTAPEAETAPAVESPEPEEA